MKALSSEAGWPDLASPMMARMGVRDRDMLERLRAAAPQLMGIAVAIEIRTERDADVQAQLARAARVGRDRGVVDNADRGHSIRSDVEIDRDARDPGRPKVRIIRARRADFLHTLKRHGSITKRQWEAVEKLRNSLERSMPALSGGSQSEIHTAPWDRVGMTDSHVLSCAKVRGAVAGLGSFQRMVLTWMVAGGSVGGFAMFAKVHHQTAVKGLRAALDVVAEFYLGPEQ